MCSCPAPLTPVIARTRAQAFDGSRCKLSGQVLDVFEKSRTISVDVPKPLDSKQLPFVLVSKAESPFTATFSSTASFIKLTSSQNSRQPLQHNRALLAMSTARPERTETFLLSVLGAQVPATWHISYGILVMAY